MDKRTELVIQDPNNDFIKRVPNAGCVVGDYQIMHNGIKIVKGSYFGDWMCDMLKLNKGSHEPQIERMFGEVMKFMKPGATMIEVGSYWAFYSMWFKKTVPDSRCFMIEPDKERLNMGVENFKLNDMEGIFFSGKIGGPGEGIDMVKFMSDNRIDFLDILHSDIQGLEGELLKGLKDKITSGKIGYLFISTHHTYLHEYCVEMLEGCDCTILANANMKQTYCAEGVIVARSNKIDGLNPVPIVLRKEKVK